MVNVEVDPNTWLAEKVPRFHALPDGDKKAIGDFCLLWGLFEGRCLQESGSIRQIEQFVDRIADDLERDNQFLEAALNYFQGRYVEAEGRFSYRFNQLHFRPGDRRNHVEAVLLGHRLERPDILKALLIIVYRFRNNLFHGPKWRYELTEQVDNFSTANALLMAVMDIVGINLD